MSDAKLREYLKFSDVDLRDNQNGRVSVKQMGLSGTIHYLFPMLFREDQIPSSVLTICQEALEIRGNVVHSGQREIDGKKLRKLINGIRQLCEILEKFKSPN